MPSNHNYDHRLTNPLYHVAWGVRFFFAGLRMLFRHPALLGLSLIPILLTLVLLLGLSFGVAWLVGQMISDALGYDLRVFAQALIFALALLAGYFLYLPVARVLLAPFSEALSRKAHAINAGAAIRQSDLGWARAMWEGLKLVVLQLVIAIFVLALSLLFPPVGAPIGIAVAVFLCG
ncbi:MAG: EI24 domain-containing protein, partial [Blastocatellia bacterium]